MDNTSIMIQSLSIKNFQSHKDSHLDFHPGVNIIVGSSDSGKTAMLRALRWLVWNRPQGDSIRSVWGGVTEVELITEESGLEVDSSIIRRKDKQDEYIMNDQSFKAFRTDVPEEITKVLNLSEINLQTQLEAPFLLSDSPGEVAQHFNKVANLDKIHKSTSNINSWIKRLNADITYKESEIETREERLKDFEHLEKFEAEVEVLEEIEKNLLNMRSRRVKLISLISDLEKKEQEIESQKELLTFEKPVNDILSLYEELDLRKSRRLSLMGLINSIEGISTQLNKEVSRQARLEVEFQESFPDVCPLCGKPK